MTHPAPTPPQKRNWLNAFFSDLWKMPGYLKGLMIGAIALMSLGLIGQARNWMDEPSSAPTAPTVQTSADGTNTRGFVSGSGEAQPTSAEPARPVETKSTWSGWSTRVGAGFLVGFIVGWIFRFFLKTMAILTALGVTIFGALSYFGIVGDISSAKTEYNNFLSWLTDQGHRLVSTIYEKLNVTVPGSFGAFFGFRRKS